MSMVVDNSDISNVGNEIELYGVVIMFVFMMFVVLFLFVSLNVSGICLMISSSLIVVSMFLMMDDGIYVVKCLVCSMLNINCSVFVSVMVIRNVEKLFSLVMLFMIIMMRFVVGLFMFSCELLSSVIIRLLIMLESSFVSGLMFDVLVIFRYSGRVIKNMMILVSMLCGKKVGEVGVCMVVGVV